jgi:transposase InsO family protein
MARKRYKPEEIVAKLRQVDVLVSQGENMLDAIRQIGVSEVTYGRKYRMLNVLDEFTHECLAIRVARKLKAIDVIDVLSGLFILRGVPAHIRSDNGPEFVAKAVQEWIAAVGAKTAYIERGSPWENDYIESFNARLRDEPAKIMATSRPPISRTAGAASALSHSMLSICSSSNSAAVRLHSSASFSTINTARRFLLLLPHHRAPPVSVGRNHHSIDA